MTERRYMCEQYKAYIMVFTSYNYTYTINDDKTEFLIFASPNSHSKMGSEYKLSVGTSSISPSQSAKNLGVMFDKSVNMECQITNICRSANYHLRNIGSIRHVLTDSSAAQLVHSFISSRLDYCNSLLTGVPDVHLKRLQSIQNNACRIVSKIKKFDHVTPTLHQLHWLPVKSRIDFKLLLLTFRILNGIAPDYLSELIVPYTPSRSLRSGDQNLLTVPRSNTKSFGDRAFAVAAPKAWNKLPLDVRSSPTLESFKKNLKTYLFKMR